MLAIASNELWNGGQQPIHPVSNVLGTGSLISFGILAWNAYKQREDFLI